MEFVERRGKVITFEGGEGAGKTAQLLRLKEVLEQYGINTIVTREPGGTRIGQQIRGVLLDGKEQGMTPKAEVLLFQAARTLLVDQVIRPAIEAGSWVLSDRFSDSTLAYQGFGHQMPLSDLTMLIKYATGGLVPDLTLLLDVDPAVGLQRKTVQKEINRIDLLGPEFHGRVRQGYLTLADLEQNRWRVIDANPAVDVVAQEIRRTVEDYFGLKAIGLLGTVG